MSNKIKYYKEISELENRIMEIKKTKGCFYIGDKVYYCPFVISKDVNFKEQTIIDCYVNLEETYLLKQETKSKKER